jgi:hypothetical protein
VGTLRGKRGVLGIVVYNDSVHEPRLRPLRSVHVRYHGQIDTLPREGSGKTGKIDDRERDKWEKEVRQGRGATTPEEYRPNSPSHGDGLWHVVLFTPTKHDPKNSLPHLIIPFLTAIEALKQSLLALSSKKHIDDLECRRRGYIE